MNQLPLPFIPEDSFAQGQAAINRIPRENLRRLMDRGLVKPGVPFYVIAKDDWSRVWTGRGRTPGFILNHLNLGGKLADMQAVL